MALVDQLVQAPLALLQVRVPDPVGMLSAGGLISLITARKPPISSDPLTLNDINERYPSPAILGSCGGSQSLEK